MNSLEKSDAEAAAVSVAPRVALSDIEGAIAGKVFATGAEAFGASPHEPLGSLTLCALTMKNGFTVIGKSAPASRENFNVELGRKLAYEDCIRQLWPLMGFALRDKLAKEKAA
jgi:hypothetical protein